MIIRRAETTQKVRFYLETYELVHSEFYTNPDVVSGFELPQTPSSDIGWSLCKKYLGSGGEKFRVRCLPYLKDAPIRVTRMFRISSATNEDYGAYSAGLQLLEVELFGLGKILRYITIINNY